MSNLPLNSVLLTSAPRSGSTLITNVINSSPKTILLNEIFTRAPHLLPNFEKYFQQGVSYDSDLREEVKSLYRHTLPFGGHLLYRNKQVRFTIDLLIKVVNHFIAKFGPAQDFSSAFFKYWYINSLHQPLFRPFYEATFAKKNPNLLFFKDVNLHKSVPGYLSLYPQGKIIFLIRHPYGYFSSTIKSRENDTRTVNIYQEALVKMFNKPSLIGEYYDGSIEAKFMLTWRLSYEQAYKKVLENYDERNVLFLRYEDFIEDMLGQSNRIFSFLDLNLPSVSHEFVRKLSDYEATQKHVRSVFKQRQTTLPGHDLNLKQKYKINSMVKESHILELFNYSLH